MQLSEKGGPFQGLSSFLRKLEEKNQPEGLRRQAQQAITLFGEMTSADSYTSGNDNDLEKEKIISLPFDELPTHSKEKGYQQVAFSGSGTNLTISESAQEAFSSSKMQGADWTEVYTGLTNSRNRSPACKYKKKVVPGSVRHRSYPQGWMLQDIVSQKGAGPGRPLIRSIVPGVEDPTFLS